MNFAPVEKDIAYLGEGRRERLDIYRVNHRYSPSPVVIFVDGGAFHSGGRSSERTRAISRPIAKAGYSVIAIDYALSKSSTGSGRWSAWPRSLLDIAAAVSFVISQQRELELDRDRIALVGASAGATLALLAAFGAAEELGAPPTAKHIRGVVNLYGRVDWRRYTVPERRAPSAETAIIASPLHWIENTSYAPAVMTLHGDEDNVVPVEQAYLLDEALKARSVSHEFHEVKGAGHSFVLESDQIKNLVLDFLARTLEIPEGVQA